MFNNLCERHFFKIETIILGILGLVSFMFMKDVSFSGDELAYQRSALSLAQYLKGEIALNEFQNLFFSRGWFMPGMSMLVAFVGYWDLTNPQFIFLSRLFVLSINLFIIKLILIELRKKYGSQNYSWFFLLAFFSPYCMLYLSALWGDLMACLLTIHIFLKLSSVGIRTYKAIFYFGINFALIAYLRGNYLLILPISFFFILYNTIEVDNSVREKIVFSMASILICILLILPWSIKISQKTDINTFTTTSFKLNQIVAFGSPEYVKTLQEEAHPIDRYPAIHVAVKARALNSGRTFGEQYDYELEQSLLNINFSDFMARLSINLKNYFITPSRFLGRFVRSSCQKSGLLCRFNKWSDGLIIKFDTVFSYTILLLLAIFMLVPIKALQAPMLGVFIKGIIFMYLVHPFVASTHQRYLVQFFPIFGLILTAIVMNKFKINQFIGFEKMTILGVIGNLGQILAASSVIVTIGILLCY